MRVKIYGKMYCPYCDLAKNLCDSYGIQYDYESVDTPDAVQELRENVSQDIKTVPAVVIDGIWVGGYEELRQRIHESYTVINGEIKNVLNG